ncbi:MAG: ester cyclase [Thermoleophilaceae bacterium]
MADNAVDVARESIECFGAGDFDRMRSLLADDSYEEEYSTQRRLEGADAQVEAARGWKAAFPDGRGTVERAISDGNTVALELTWEGTQTGSMRAPDGQEMPASNRRATVHACQVMEIEDGKIKATHHYFDLMTILQQLGAMERAGAAA